MVGFTEREVLWTCYLQKDLDEIMCCTRQKKNAKRRKRRAKQHNSRSRIAGEDISAAEPSTTSTTTVIDSGVWDSGVWDCHSTIPTSFIVEMLFCFAIYIFWNQREHFPLIPGAICVVLWVDLQHCNCGLSQIRSSLYTIIHFLFSCAIFWLQNNLISAGITASATSAKLPNEKNLCFWYLMGFNIYLGSKENQ